MIGWGTGWDWMSRRDYGVAQGGSVLLLFAVDGTGRVYVFAHATILSVYHVAQALSTGGKLLPQCGLRNKPSRFDVCAQLKSQNCPLAYL